jgi:DNA replication and repair protein RecF
MTLPQPQNFKTKRWIRRICLQQFRSYKTFDQSFLGKMIALVGHNGIGKTNLLEAISFFSPGRGFRRAKFRDVLSFDGDLEQGWAASLSIDDGTMAPFSIGTAVSFQSEREKRQLKVQGEILKNQSQMTEYLHVLWLVPQMDRLFHEGSSLRRQFLDRIVFGFEPSHSQRINRYDHYVRERMHLLEKGGLMDPLWYDAVERKIAEDALAIAFTRQKVVDSLNALENLDLFPRPLITIEWDGQDILAAQNPLEGYMAKLKSNRTSDRFARRTLFGVHRSDMSVHWSGKSALFCSTGEQKALLLSIIMNTATLHCHQEGIPPILLLDEVVAHLDENRRIALLKSLDHMDIQVWMTGTDKLLFEGASVGLTPIHME